MVAPCQSVSYWLTHAVAQQHAKIISKHCISYRGVDAYACRDADKDQVLGAQLLQGCIKLCPVETTESCFLNHDILLLRLKLWNNIGVPGVSNEKTARSPTRCLCSLTNAKVQMSHAIYRIFGS